MRLEKSVCARAFIFITYVYPGHGALCRGTSNVSLLLLLLNAALIFDHVVRRRAATVAAVGELMERRAHKVDVRHTTFEAFL